MAILQCPNCNSTDIKDKKKQSKGIGGGIGATIGAVAFGPLGLAAGAFLGSKLGSNHKQMVDKKGRNFNWFECRQCEALFTICPECNRSVRALNIIKFNNLPNKYGYNIEEGYKCPYCQNIFSDPFYK